ncbi:MAG: hypothetical protein PHT78_09495 [Desulfitobacteriaceae bacterium]|nr:hypothetical protein [Desulfitobacteriaceae bacterium]MDD4753461.1 hypothetical protein [Desulfitobacteriaceae bacterium]
MSQTKNTEGTAGLENLFKVLCCGNLTDAERMRILIFLTELVAACLKVDTRLSN